MIPPVNRVEEPNSHEKLASVEGLPVARTRSGSSAYERAEGAGQHHDDVVAHDGRISLVACRNIMVEILEAHS